MNGSNIKAVSEAGKNAGTVLGQVDEYVDSIGNDFDDGNWIRGTVKIVVGVFIAGCLVVAVSKLKIS